MADYKHQLVCDVKALASELKKSPTCAEFVARTTHSERQIRKHFGAYSILLQAAGLAPNIYAAKKYRQGPTVKDGAPSDSAVVEIKLHTPRPPRILLIDIETSNVLCRTWGTWDVNVGENQIVRDWSVISYCAKFLDEEKIYYMDQRFSPVFEDDKMLLEGIHHLLHQADIVVGHNCKKFDIPKLEARFLKNGLGPTSSYRIHDTLRIAKRHFKLTKNTLSFVAKFLGCTNKDTHKDFIGQELWNECEAGNLDAWYSMEKYNKLDVIVLEEVYLKLLPWDKSTNYNIFFERNKCVCGSEEFVEHGEKVTNTGKFKRYLCQGCRKEYTAKENLVDPELRKLLLRN